MHFERGLRRCAITKHVHAFPTLVILKIPQMFTWVIFEDIENGRHLINAYLSALQY